MEVGINVETLVAPDAEDFIFEGKNQKKIFIAAAGEANPDMLLFLEKILKAAGFEMQDDALFLMITPSEYLWFNDICRKHPILHAIFFGVTPKKAGLNVLAKLYQPLHFDGKVFLFADDLTKIEATPDLKRLLWGALKEMFLK